MKNGDLVWYTCEQDALYGGDDVPWDEDHIMIPSDLMIGYGDVGLVLKITDDDEWQYVKLSHPQGIGWIPKVDLELIQCKVPHECGTIVS